MSTTATLADVHATLTRAAADGATTPSPLVPGDLARLDLFAAVSGAGTVVWPTKDALATALGQGLSAQGPGAAGATSPDGIVSWQVGVQVLLAPGEHEIGPFEIALHDAAGAEVDRATIPPVTVSVATVLEQDAASRIQEATSDPEGLAQAVSAELAPLRGPWTLVGPASPWWFLLIPLVLAALVLAAYAWRRRRRRLPAPGVREAAHVRARRRLAALAASRDLEDGRHLAWHVELGDTLKAYLDEQLGTDLVERTTEEVRRLLGGPLRTRAGLGESREPILRVLAACDVVKFARVRPLPEEARPLVDAVLAVVDATIPAATDGAGAAAPRPAERGVA